MKDVTHRLAPFGIALAIVIGLFCLLAAMTRVQTGEQLEGIEVIDSVELVEVEPQKETPEEQMQRLESPPPPPPSAPPAMSTSDIPQPALPALAEAPLLASSISMPVSLGASGLNLGSSGAFGGFAGRGGGLGSGSGGGGIGKGKGFKGRELIPLSTARPQMPEWACKQKIKGWVEVVFTVMPNGRVQDVKLVDANPRGVFEAAAIDSISNWIYSSSDKAREVKQRVPMLPEDCDYNWR